MARAADVVVFDPARVRDRASYEQPLAMCEGIAAVFVNLARRSQALLSRQLTLLDEMERVSPELRELVPIVRAGGVCCRSRRCWRRRSD